MTLILAHTSGLISGDRRLLSDASGDTRPDSLGVPKIWRSGGWLLGWCDVAAVGLRLEWLFDPEGFTGSDHAILDATARIAKQKESKIWDKVTVIAVRAQGGPVFIVEGGGAYPTDDEWGAVGSASQAGLAAARAYELGWANAWADSVFVSPPAPVDTAKAAHAIAREVNVGTGGRVDILAGEAPA